MIRPLACLIGLGSCLLAISCGEDEPGIDVNTGPIQLGRLLTEARTAQCDYLVRCTFLPSSNDCGTAAALDGELVQLVRDTENGIVTYDENAARNWVNAVRDRPCHNTVGAQKAVDDAWELVFTGKAAVGAPCLVDGQCTGQNLCDVSACMPNAACCAGVCVEYAPLPAGSDCSAGQVCAAGTQCLEDVESGSQVCTTLPGASQPCFANLPCGDGLSCDVESETCFQLSNPGEPCNPMLGNACLDFTTYCDTTTETCTKRAAAGQACGGESNTPCVLYASCNAMGFCEAPPIPGAPCDDSSTCLVDQFCQDNECYPAVDPVACGPIAY